MTAPTKVKRLYRSVPSAHRVELVTDDPGLAGKTFVNFRHRLYAEDDGAGTHLPAHSWVYDLGPIVPTNLSWREQLRQKYRLALLAVLVVEHQYHAFDTYTEATLWKNVSRRVAAFFFPRQRFQAALQQLVADDLAQFEPGYAAFGQPATYTITNPGIVEAVLHGLYH